MSPVLLDQCPNDLGEACSEMCAFSSPRSCVNAV